MNKRKDDGGFINDTPEFELEPARAPIKPNQFRTISRRMWAINPTYMLYPEVSETAGRFADPAVRGPVTRQFMNARDEFCLYREEMAKPGNKAVMRKGGGSMQKTV